VNDTYFAVPLFLRLIKIFIDKPGHLRRGKAVKVHRIFDRDFYRIHYSIPRFGIL